MSCGQIPNVSWNKDAPCITASDCVFTVSLGTRSKLTQTRLLRFNAVFLHARKKDVDLIKRPMSAQVSLQGKMLWMVTASVP